MITPTTASLLLFVYALFPVSLFAQSKHALTTSTRDDLHKLIRLQPGEYPWDAIPWYASLWHARKAAAKEGKPILIFGTGGAGFNDPLGNC
jgi:hypothetical protein